jgi:pyrroloquinoline quinone (PQQ) biosynthesis protein C
MYDYLNKLLERLDTNANPYLRAVREGTLRRADFVETQIQFLFAVVYFPRPMMVLASRLPRPEQRMCLLRNIDDEHGGDNPSMGHEQSFLQLLDALGVTRAAIDRRALWPEVRAFNAALGGLCSNDDPFTALAALAMIEDLYSSVSEELGRSIISRGWLPCDQLNHYAANEVQDVEHARSFYDVLEDLHLTSPRNAYQIEQGFEVGAYLLLRLFSDLYRCRERRWSRDVSGPHSAEGWFLDDLHEARDGDGEP